MSAEGGRDDEGPYAVYDCYCLKCGARTVAVAPIEAEAHELWECHYCLEMTETWHRHPEDER